MGIAIDWYLMKHLFLRFITFADELKGPELTPVNSKRHCDSTRDCA